MINKLRGFLTCLHFLLWVHGNRYNPPKQIKQGRILEIMHYEVPLPQNAITIHSRLAHVFPWGARLSFFPFYEMVSDCPFSPFHEVLTKWWTILWAHQSHDITNLRHRYYQICHFWTYFIVHYFHLIRVWWEKHFEVELCLSWMETILWKEHT